VDAIVSRGLGSYDFRTGIVSWEEIMAEAQTAPHPPKLNEAFLRLEAPAKRQATAAKVVKYTKPEILKTKAFIPLAKSDVMLAAVQVFRSGGETSFHTHTGMDGLWFVLRGRARFYGGTDKDDKTLIAECGAHEGVFLPRHVWYWFEQVGDEELEVLQVESFAKGEPNKTVRHQQQRQDHAPGSDIDIYAQDGKLADLETVE